MERLHQSQALGSLYKDMLAVQMSLEKLENQLNYTEYRGVSELEGAVKALQVSPGVTTCKYKCNEGMREPEDSKLCKYL